MIEMGLNFLTLIALLCPVPRFSCCTWFDCTRYLS